MAKYSVKEEVGGYEYIVEADSLEEAVKIANDRVELQIKQGRYKDTPRRKSGEPGLHSPALTSRK